MAVLGTYASNCDWTALDIEITKTSWIEHKNQVLMQSKYLSFEGFTTMIFECPLVG